MADDYRDKIEQIRARRNRDQAHPTNPYSAEAGAREGAGRAGVSRVQQTGVSPVGDREMPLLGPDFKSPWLRDRVTLSLEGQIAMIEQRAVFRANPVDLGYSNRISILPIRPGIFVKVEPPGTYRLVYHNR